MKKIRLLLAGKKGLITLKRLVNNADFLSQIHCVVIAKDKDVIEDYYYDIESVCNAYDINLKDESESDYTIAIGWRKLLKGTKNLIVLHDSLLPKYRGFAPLVTALLNKDPMVGVTAFFACNEFDAGYVIDQYMIEIDYPITISDAIDKVGKLYADITEKIFKKILNEEKIESRSQVGKSSYSVWRDKDDYQVDWTMDSEYICRFVDAVGYPYLGAYTSTEDKNLRIIKCKKIKDRNIVNRKSHIGKVFNIEEGNPIIICGKGLVKILNMTFDGMVINILPWIKLRTKFK